MSTISPKDIARAIYAESKGKSGEELSKVLGNSVEFLAKKNLLSKAPEILQHLEEIQDTESGVVRAKVTSAKPLAKVEEEHLRGTLRERYKAKEVLLEMREDQTLLGGTRIEGKGEVIDLTLKNKISQLQNHLLENSISN